MFVFADGRRCQMLPSADDIDLCYFHAKKHYDRITAQEAGLQINEFLATTSSPPAISAPLSPPSFPPPSGSSSPRPSL
jgi:hypothetical protein